MTDAGPVEAYRRAVARLADMERAVAMQEDQGSVLEALTELHLAVVRAYGGQRPKASAGRGARGKILAYLQGRIGEWVYGEELAAVSGIGEWARRVRELRVEQGYVIDEEAGMYRLVRREPDEAALNRRRSLDAVRGSEGSPAEKVPALLTTFVGRVVDVADLAYVTRAKEATRLVVELRDEHCWPVESSVDSPDLAPGQFRLVSVDEEDRRDAHQRRYPETLRHRVFERDRYTCWKCRRSSRTIAAEERPHFYLEVHHLQAVGDQLEGLSVEALNDMSNLATYCHQCLRDETARRTRQRRVEGYDGIDE